VFADTHTGRGRASPHSETERERDSRESASLVDVVKGTKHEGLGRRDSFLCKVSNDQLETEH